MITIVNKTDYDNRSLRTFFTEVCKHHYGAEETKEWQNLTVYVKYYQTRMGYLSYGMAIAGSAYLNSDAITIKLPKVDITSNYLKRKLAWVTVHELLHRDGIDHNRMRGNYYNKWASGEADKFRRLAFANKLKLTKQIPQEKKMPTLLEKQIHRYKEVLAKIKEHESFIKRRKTILLKWKDKKWYLENAFKQANIKPPTIS